MIVAAMISGMCGLTAFADNAAATEPSGRDLPLITATIDTPDESEEILTPAKSPLTDAPEEQKRKRMGDLNFDDEITSSDALGSLRAAVFRNVDPMDKQLSDVDGNGTCSASDALQILRNAVNLDEDLLRKPDNSTVIWYKNSTDQYCARFDDGSIPDGLVRVDDYILGFEDGVLLVNGKMTIDGKRYRFNEFGILVEGWQNVNGSMKYYLRGKEKNGWFTVFDQKFYFVDNTAVTGWKDIDGKKMYFSNYGLVSEGFTTIDGKTFYFDETYDNKTGMLDIHGDVYYLYEDGGMAEGLTAIDGDLYFFQQKHGNAVMGWQTIDTDRYYFGSDFTAVIGETVIDDSTYKFGSDGKMITGWVDPESHTHYIIDGGNAHEFTSVDGVLYYFNTDGTVPGKQMMVTDEESGSKYLILEDGRCAVGEFVIDGDTYVYGENGAMITGWLTTPRSGKYLLNGSIATGLIEIDGQTYNFDSTGTLYSGFYTDSTGTYFKNERGENQFGWIDYDGYTYYFGSDGRATSGYATIDGNLYYFDEYFRMLRNTSFELYRIDENGVCHKINIVDGSTIKYKADDIISQIGTSTSALCNYVHSHVAYYFINEPMVYANPYAADWASIAAFACNRGYGACYHYSAFLHVLLQRAGYTSRIIVGTGFYPSLHSYNQVLINGEWLTFDAYYNYQACSTGYMQSLGFTYDHFIYYSYD